LILPGRVHDHHVDAALDALVDGVERHARRVSAVTIGTHDLGTDPVPPRLQLVNGRGAERVGRAEQHALSVTDQDPRQLGARRRLPGPVDANDEHDSGPVAVPGGVQRPVQVRAHLGQQQSPQQGPDLVGVPGARHLDLGAQIVDELPGRGDPHVGRDQGLLNLLPRLLVQAVGGEQAEQGAAQRRLRPGQPAAQPDEPARRRRRLLDRRGWRNGRRGGHLRRQSAHFGLGGRGGSRGPGCLGPAGLRASTRNLVAR
jgi:hypothetical protein